MGVERDETLAAGAAALVALAVFALRMPETAEPETLSLQS
jgi:hypothetical protein